MLTAKVTTKGQITIPKAVRDKLGLSPGERLLFKEENDEFVIKKIVLKSSLDKWVGYLNKSETTSSDEIVDELRG
ncbi:MAG: AbrB/MazE/SpoVT family DNA-binding domain-containing protein [Spirochaetaceae bacterium]|nr:AbrB/MazE/SpoVT family DNA-binding domain-containing protein [Spirochaetaceae bacterium]RKX68828.1 MAG: AbrB/MazE/SpoVT family DNA-binding domain-containing protein [Spirochaetota bacterium]RKX73275.1 MAG: AbrB/MazE/SpoVT family DNA-binding domain-containing protein [Spirochaetota bacterium]RKX89279.1 MAG: AbrB/MazE/SpoVT family DNA-binding domain-containing protein [Spirochaetota bacterium]RKX98320.1 MAG: AbrB/MazE/SpoVT family DNA-binding domain-containing protein [Spirochaetota bacterium]